MTDNFVSKKCCHCGTVAEYPMPSDFKVAVPKYLDGKPFEDGNFELKRTVMRCPKCGYASFDVSKSILKDSSIVSSDEYESIIKSDLFPKYIANYIAIGYIYERQSEYYHASHAYLCAAWGCRDEKREKEAEILLEKAAKLILKHIGSSEFKAHPDLNMLQCAVDILRQIREFDNAKKLAAYALSKNLPEDMRKLFLLEQSLCDNYIYAPHAFKPQNETKITSLQELFNRFAEAKTGDDKMKLQAFADAFEFVNSIKYKDVEKGVWLVANPFLNQGFDFNKGVNLTRDALTEKKAPQKAAEMPIKPQQPVLKVFTKAEDLKPQRPEIPQETAPVEEEILVEEEPVETVAEPIEPISEERIETVVEPPRPIKVFTSVDDLKAEEEVKEALEEPAYEEIEQPEPENIPEETEETFPEEQPISEETEDVDVPEELDEPEENEPIEEIEQLPEEPVEEENFFEETEEEEDLQPLDEAKEAEPLSEEEMEAPDDEPIDDQPLEDDFVEETAPEEEEPLEEEEIKPETAPKEITEDEISEDRPLDDEEKTVEELETEAEEEQLETAPEEPVGELEEEEIDEEPEETVEETTVSEDESEDSDLDEPEDQPLEEPAIEEEISDEEPEVVSEEPAFEEELEETPAEPEEQLPEEEIAEELPTEDFIEPTEVEAPEVEPTEEPAEVGPEAQTESETMQQTPETETEEEEEMEGFATTYEEQCETITTLASIDGAISVSEVQSLFEYGFVKARDILNRMADDGLLERTDDPENFRYVK